MLRVSTCRNTGQETFLYFSREKRQLTTRSLVPERQHINTCCAFVCFSLSCCSCYPRMRFPWSWGLTPVQPLICRLCCSVDTIRARARLPRFRCCLLLLQEDPATTSKTHPRSQAIMNPRTTSSRRRRSRDHRSHRQDFMGSSCGFSNI